MNLLARNLHLTITPVNVFRKRGGITDEQWVPSSSGGERNKTWSWNRALGFIAGDTAHFQTQPNEKLHAEQTAHGCYNQRQDETQRSALVEICQALDELAAVLKRRKLRDGWRARISESVPGVLWTMA